MRIRRQTALVALLSLVALTGCSEKPQPSQTPAQEAWPAKARIEFRNASARYDLERDENRGGHTLSRHVGRSDEQLAERLRRERNISAASTWTDREIAEATVAEGLAAEQSRIENWKRRGERRPNLALHFDAGRPIGRSLRRGASEAVACTSAVIVLRADGADGFYVLTTYPEARE